MSSFPYRFGYKPSPIQPKDKSIYFRMSPQITSAVERVDLRSSMPPIVNQGDLSACTAVAVATAYQYDLMKAGVHTFLPSYLFLYYNERVLEECAEEDCGAFIPSGMKSISTLGIAPENWWPYDESKVLDKPTPQAYTEAKKHRCTSYYRVGQSQDQIHQALINGFPIIAGLNLYDSFCTKEVSKSGTMIMPPENDMKAGGHAVVIVGFDNTTQRYVARNSWGTSWGQDGHFTIPYAYLLNPDYCTEMWVMATIQDSGMKLVSYSKLTRILKSLWSGLLPKAIPPTLPEKSDLSTTIEEILGSESVHASVQNFTEQILEGLKNELVLHLTTLSNE